MAFTGPVGWPGMYTICLAGYRGGGLFLADVDFLNLVLASCDACVTISRVRDPARIWRVVW